MFQRPGLLAILLVLFLLLFAASPAASSVAPTSFAVGGAFGLGLDLGGESTFDGAAPMAQMGWRLAERLSLRTDISYLSGQRPATVVDLRSPALPGDLTYYAGQTRNDGGVDRYLPVGVGLRLYLRQTPAASGHGAFIEASSTLSMAWLPLPYGFRGDEVRVLRGVRAAVGGRFAATDGTRGEIGLAYYSMERATTSADYGVSWPGNHATRNFHFAAVALYVTFGFGD